MFLDGFLRVMGTGGVEAALIANQVTQRVLIDSDQLDGNFIQHSLDLL